MRNLCNTDRLVAIKAPRVALSNCSNVIIICGQMEHKAAFVVIFSSVLIHMNSIGSDTFIYHADNEDGTLAYVVSQGAADTQHT